MISRAVIPAAGLGTRLLPCTKELPKEMLPVYVGFEGSVVLKPVLQVVFESLFSVGFREFCFVVGRGKRAIEDHFTPDYGYLELLRSRGKVREVRVLEYFYRCVRDSNIVWVNQDSPRGFGDAVLCARVFSKDSPFMVYAGDTLVFSRDNGHILKLIDVFERFHADAVFFVAEVEDPRIYGVVDPGDEVADGVVSVRRVVEKPREPPSNLAILPIYIFDPVIFKALEGLEPGSRGEVELTDGIQRLIDWGLSVYTVRLGEGDAWLDVRTPDGYWRVLRFSYRLVVGLRGVRYES